VTQGGLRDAPILSDLVSKLVSTLRALTVQGFKSFAHLDLALNPGVNVIVGANGAGKSNFVSLFRFLNALIRERLQVHVGESGGASRLLYYGSKVTPTLSITLRFGANGYEAELIAAEDALIFASEHLYYAGHYYPSSKPWLGSGHRETKAVAAYKASPKGMPLYVVPPMRSWRVYHFHDTSPSARVKAKQPLTDYQQLHGDAGNIAPFLYHLRERSYPVYERVRDVVRQMFPQFGDFALDPATGEDTLQLLWREQESDVVFGPNQLSDGTLRFICLATLLLQPNPPTTIIVDEPELGLHPAALNLLAELVKEASQRRQVVMTTQSVSFLDAFSPNEVIVVDRARDSKTGRYASTCRRLDGEEYAAWLEEYTLGELWLKNVIGGRP
jgi:predicted ATPase